MSTVNLSISTVARIIHILTKRQGHAETNMAHDLARAIELAATGEAPDHSKIQVNYRHPDGTDEPLKQVLGRGLRQVTWPTPDRSSDIVDAFHMAWIGVDPAKPKRQMLPAAKGCSYESFIAVGWTDKQLVEHGYMAAGNPVFDESTVELRDLHLIAKELNSFTPAWERLNYDSLKKYIIRVIKSNRDVSEARNTNLSDRFDILEKIRKLVGAASWVEICNKITNDNYDDAQFKRELRQVLKALPTEGITEAATRQMKNADSNATAAEILAFIVKDLKLLPGVDIHQHVMSFRHANTELLHEVKRERETSEYRRKCLDDVANILNLDGGQRTPQYVVEAVGRLKNKEYGGLIDELRDMLALESGESIKDAIVDLTTKYSEVAADNITYRNERKALCKIRKLAVRGLSDKTNLKAICAVLDGVPVSEAQDGAYVPTGDAELELLRAFRNRVIKVVQSQHQYNSQMDFLNDLQDAVNHGVK